VVYSLSGFYHKTKVLATARMALKQQGIAGLNQAPCLRALISSLPIILREQHTYEKVGITHVVRVVCWCFWGLLMDSQLVLRL